MHFVTRRREHVLRMRSTCAAASMLSLAQQQPSFSRDSRRWEFFLRLNYLASTAKVTERMMPAAA
jgi:hypothetical protein